jgi:[acyl-carrier-protein] S-malonyltransferase
VLERGASVATVVARRDEHEIIVSHGGEILEWLVEEGDPVAPGQPLLRIHPTGSFV